MSNILRERHVIAIFAAINYTNIIKLASPEREDTEYGETLWGGGLN